MSTQYPDLLFIIIIFQPSVHPSASVESDSFIMKFSNPLPGPSLPGVVIMKYFSVVFSSCFITHKTQKIRSRENQQYLEWYFQTKMVLTYHYDTARPGKGNGQIFKERWLDSFSLCNCIELILVWKFWIGTM